jgi:hypothetical protein
MVGLAAGQALRVPRRDLVPYAWFAGRSVRRMLYRCRLLMVEQWGKTQ